MLATLFVACTPEEYDHFFTITGTVVDYSTGEPLNTVHVTLTPGGYAPCTTGSDGFFQFKEVEADDGYRVWFEKEGYKPDHREVKAIAGETVNLIIALKKQNN